MQTCTDAHLLNAGVWGSCITETDGVTLKQGVNNGSDDSDDSDDNDEVTLSHETQSQS